MIKTYWLLIILILHRKFTVLAPVTSRFTQLISLICLLIYHIVLIEYLKKLVFVCVKNEYKTFYADVCNNSSYRFHSSTDLLYLVDFLLINSYCRFAGITYKQNKRVPQADNLSPLLADIAMSVFEFEYSKTTILECRHLIFRLCL